MSLTDLPILGTAYPDSYTWRDISGMLANGCVEDTPGSCGVAVQGNFVVYDFRIDTSSATSGEKAFFLGLPDEVMPSGMRAPLSSMDGDPVGLLMRWNRMEIAASSSVTLDSYNTLAAMFTMRRN